MMRLRCYFFQKNIYNYNSPSSLLYAEIHVLLYMISAIELITSSVVVVVTLYFQLIFISIGLPSPSIVENIPS